MWSCFFQYSAVFMENTKIGFFQKRSRPLGMILDERLYFSWPFISKATHNRFSFTLLLRWALTFKSTRKKSLDNTYVILLHTSLGGQCVQAEEKYKVVRIQRCTRESQDMIFRYISLFMFSDSSQLKKHTTSSSLLSNSSIYIYDSSQVYIFKQLWCNQKIKLFVMWSDFFSVKMLKWHKLPYILKI